MTEIILDGENLTFEQTVAVAYGKPNEPRVVLSEKAKQQVNRASEAVQKLLERGEIAYGITTGFGAFKDKIISREEVEKLQRNIVVSHAVGVGNPFDIPTTRGDYADSCEHAGERFFGALGSKLWSFCSNS